MPERDARELVRHALRADLRGFLLLDPASPLDPEAEARIDALLARREAQEPLQYLLGTVPFCELEIEVGPGVLIPRPETEVLVERLTHWLQRSGRDRRVSGGEGESPPWMIDVGTGSGAILLALLGRFPGWSGLGVDLSREALGYARRNLARAVAGGRADLASRVHFLQADLLDPVAAPVSGGGLTSPSGGAVASPSGGGLTSPSGGVVASSRGGPRVQLIVSNPPYVPSGDVAGLAPEVRDHEPRLALDGGEDGLVLVRRIAERARGILAPGGLLAFELAPDQSGVVAAFLGELGLECLECYRDLAGRPRGVIARSI